MVPITGDSNRPASPPSVQVRYSVRRPEAVLLEGRPVTELVQEALRKARLGESDDARFVLAVNVPGAAPVPASEQPHRDVETHDRDLEAFASVLEADARAGRRITVADLAYEGGFERALWEKLDRFEAEALFGKACHGGGVSVLRLLVEVARGVLEKEQRESRPAARGPERRSPV